MWKEYTAEFVGTAVLVFVGCGSVVVGAYGSSLLVGTLPIALAFGLTVTSLIYALGPVSGCHINPAVTAAMWAAGRLKLKQLPGYVAAQLAGGIAGAGLLLLILNGRLGTPFDVASGLGQNGWGDGYLGQYDVLAAFVTEFSTTAFFILVILGATARESTGDAAGLAIGAALTVIILAFLNITGVSLNPARSLGPAVFVGSHALSQVWLFFLAPLSAALLVGFGFRSRAALK
ncbi:aquaporin [Bradyrhizobium japonicum]|uniref:aquaporin n=1 Tax=Bradyrhizobium japonicum TaxID=375 RepID=UPI00057606EE|nr:aquaporin [Bradyrhizobium japonicum]